MTDRREIDEIVRMYAKHGWNLRRVLLSGATAQRLAGTASIGELQIEPSDFDGLWFSRVSRPGSESWELRRLGGTPYALVAVIDDSADDAERDEALKSVENRMRSTLFRGN